MFNSLILDVAIGLVFVYFILSLLCSVAIEVISWIFKWRASMLRQKIGDLIKDPEAVKNLYANPLFLGETPSYISSRSFVLALLGSLKDHTQVKKELANAPAPLLDSVENIKSLVQNLPEESYIRTALVPLLDSAQGNLNQALDSMGQWYDEAMERVSGWYKRKSQVIGVVLAFLIALLLNANTIQISQTLYGDQTVRNAMVGAATQAVQAGNPTEIKAKLEAVTNFLEPKSPPPPEQEAAPPGKLFTLPLGWPDLGTMFSLDGIFNGYHLLGIIITALMVTLGSNFWFELLNRLINLRSSGKKPLTVEEEKAKA